HAQERYVFLVDCLLFVHKQHPARESPSYTGVRHQLNTKCFMVVFHPNFIIYSSCFIPSVGDEYARRSAVFSFIKGAKSGDYTTY
ncbi:MAG: hypothetical protein ORN54_13180, partial [Cyclobacteriaceae bacterium]|nr:hypothetical protein [Cyclobacteriaceae bacterium]